jgi:tetratricopeptide (TPR) repeat protein
VSSAFHLNLKYLWLDFSQLYQKKIKIKGLKRPEFLCPMKNDSPFPSIANKKKSFSTLTAIAAIVLIGFFAYSNSFNGEFIFDDRVCIVENPSIRQLWPIKDVLRAPLGTGIAGRPIINLSLAVNYAISGENVWSYHVFNFLIHVLSALTLFGIIRITLLWKRLPDRYHGVSTELAFSCAILWMVHPLQTQAVTYIIQRCESLMGLAFLLTLYCAIRGWTSENSRFWHLIALVAFFVGTGAKEVIVVAPFLLFLYDWLFVHENTKEALKKSQLLYAGLALGLLLLGFQVAAGGTVESGPFKTTATPFQYSTNQCRIIFHYLRLAFWPDKLCLDYYWSIARFAEIFPFCLLILALCAYSIWLVLKRNPLGFAAIWFFAILSPTSSIMPLDELISEHRMYLPLAGLVALTIVCGYEAGRRLISRLPFSKTACHSIARYAGFVLLVITVGVLAVLTFHRNSDYKSKVRIWADTVKKQPQNPRANYNLGHALAESGKYQEAIVYFQEAVKIKPTYFDALKNLAIVFTRINQPEKAVSPLHKALIIRPDSADAHYSLGTVMVALGKPQEAVPHFLKVLETQWNNSDAHNNLGVALTMIGKQQEAIFYFRKALDLQKNNAAARTNLEAALAATEVK